MLRRLFFTFIIISTFTVAGCKISGTITTDDGTGVGGVTVYLEGEGEDGDASIIAITLADGTYAFEGFHHGTLTITPESGDHTFIPDSVTMTVDFFENVLDVDFTAVVEEPEPPRSSEKPTKPWSTYQRDADHDGYVPVYLNTNEFSFGWDWHLTDSFPLITETLPLHPVVAGDGWIFVTTDGDNSDDDNGPNLVVCLDITGNESWSYDFNDLDSPHPVDYINPPAYDNDTVYIQSGGDKDSFLWAINAISGELLFDPPTPFDNQYFRYYAPTIYDGNVYIGGGEYGGAFGFDGLDLEELWHADLSNADQWTPAVNEDYVIAYTGIAAFDAKLTVINRSTGEVAFSIPDPNFEFRSGNHMDLAPVLISQNNVIVIQGGRLINFDLTNGVIGWQIPKQEEKEGEEAEEGEDEEEEVEGRFSGQPSVANGIIYTFYEGSLQARDEVDGSFIWEWQLPDENGDENDDESDNAPFPMIVTENLIFVSTASKTYAVDLESQTEVWRYPDGGGHLAISNDGLLFIATAEGNLIAINLLKN